MQNGFLNRAARFLDRVVFFCLLGVIVLTAIPYGTVDPWWVAVFECGVFALTAIWLIEVLLRRSWQARKLLVLLPMTILTAYAFLQSVNLPGFLASDGSPIPRHSLSIDQYQTHLTAVKMLALTLFTGLLLQHVSTLRRLRWVVHVVIALGLASALFAFARQLLQSADSTNGFVLPFLYPGVGYGQFLSQNVFGFLVEMSVALVMGLLLGGGVRRQYVLPYLAVGLLIWASLVLSYSRGAFLGFLCQAVFLLFVGSSWLFSHRRERARDATPGRLGLILSSIFVRILVVLVIAVVLTAGVFWMGGQQLASRLEEKNDTNTSIDGTTRKDIWQSSWQLVKHSPWTGVGFGAYYLAIPQYQIGSGRIKVEQAHNDYLDLAANGGIVAVVIVGLFVAMVIWRARFALKSTNAYRRAAALGAVGGLLSVGVHSLADFGLQITGIAVVAMTLVVITVAEIPVSERRT
jgi:O-antigen ligase